MRENEEKGEALTIDIMGEGSPQVGYQWGLNASSVCLSVGTCERRKKQRYRKTGRNLETDDGRY